MSNRNVNVDMIRIVACIAVVGLHAFPKDISKTTGLIYYFFGFAVPFFFMSSGYFLLNRGKIGIQYSKKKVFRNYKIDNLLEYSHYYCKDFKTFYNERKVSN